MGTYYYAGRWKNLLQKYQEDPEEGALDKVIQVHNQLHRHLQTLDLTHASWVIWPYFVHG